MSSEQCWRINIRNIATKIAVGIHDHEKTPQRVLVNVTVESLYAPKPDSIDECFNYDHVRRLVVEEWPGRQHIPLLETCVTGLLEYIFRTDLRVVYAKASVCKPDIFPEVDSVGVEAEWTRADYERFK